MSAIRSCHAQLNTGRKSVEPLKVGDDQSVLIHQKRFEGRHGLAASVGRQHRFGNQLGRRKQFDLKRFVRSDPDPSLVDGLRLTYLPNATLDFDETWP